MYENNKSPLEKILRTIELNYKKSPYFDEYFSDLKAILMTQPRLLNDLNQKIILWVCQKLGMERNLSNPQI